jgi:hypothetical protein
MKRFDILGILGSDGWEMVGTARTKEYAGSTLELYFKIKLTN